MKRSSIFFTNIANQLYTYNYKIGEMDFFNDVAFIEAKHSQVEFKGIVFYKNLINAMPVFGERLADETKGELPTYREKIFRDVLAYCKKSIDEIENASLPTNNKSTGIITPRTFEGIFKNKNNVEKSIDALRKVSPPIIDEKGAYCLGEKSKGAMVAFVAVLKIRSIIQHVPESELAPILNRKFPQLNITDRTLRNLETRVYNRYYNELLALIK